jgi:dipeptidyl aminopeptidase/acylaminoacyl peptidase
MQGARAPWRWSLIALLVAFATVSLAAGQAATAKKRITHDVYDSWRSIQGTKISRDGTWLVYALVPQEGDGDLVARNLKTNSEFRQPRGRDPLITVDGKFVVFTIVPLKADTDKAKKEKKQPEEMPKNALGIMDLSTGRAVTVERVKNFKVPEESGRFVAYLMEAQEKKAEEKKEPAEKPEEKPAAKTKEKKKDVGTELLVRELATGAVTSIPEVTEYVWNKPGTWIAYGVSSDPRTPDKDGAFARRVADGTVKTLMTGQGHYKGLAFDEAGAQLAFLSERDDYKADAAPFKLYYWTDKADAAAELASAKTAGMTTGWAPSENGTLEFSKDGARLFFGTAPAPKAEPEDAPEPVKVDIWSWKDPELQPMQKVRAEQEKKRDYRAVVHLKNRKFVQLATMDVPTVTLVESAKVVLGRSDVPYQQLVSWDSSYEDIYIISLEDGARRKLIEKSRNGATLSPGGTYLLTFNAQDYNWYAYRVSDGLKTNLTAKLGVKFYDETNDTPEPAPSLGSAGWTDGDGSVLLYDRYDIWDVKPEGSGARNITNGLGRKQKLVFRYQRLDPDEKTINPAKPLLLSTTDDTTKATGYYRAQLGGTADPAKIAMLDKLFGSLIKAKNAETQVFTLQRFDEFPDLWVGDGRFANMIKVSNANPQQADYVWGKSELIDYVNADGKTLRAILTKPDDFDPSKKYPLMIYIYEELTNTLHRYMPPAPGTSINLTRFVSNGYVLLQPDIVYETGYPGKSAMKCVLPAIEQVVKQGYIDPERIGIQGHSWGGYEITYMITQTDIFRAVEAGASVVNMTSAYGGIRWGSGMSRAFQYERSQSRIGAPPWERPLQFIENSPLFWIERVQTPYLTIHNDEDDAVPWYQGIEFFSAMRRLGKEAYMFNFNGEKHGLRERENQKYWTVHLCEFFDHYLLGAPRPEWMDKPVPYLERGKRDMDAIYKPAKEAKDPLKK